MFVDFVWFLVNREIDVLIQFDFEGKQKLQKFINNPLSDVEQLILDASKSPRMIPETKESPKKINVSMKVERKRILSSRKSVFDTDAIDIDGSID